MGRLISKYEIRQPAQNLTGRGGLAGGGGPPPPNGKRGSIYLDLILKMIPAEIVTLYTFAIKLVPLAVSPRPDQSGATTGSSGLQTFLPWGLFALGVILTPLALYFQEDELGPKWVKARNVRLILATLAFPVWAYATTGDQLPGIAYNYALSLILVAVFAVVAGIIARAVAPK